MTPPRHVPRPSRPDRIPGPAFALTRSLALFLTATLLPVASPARARAATDFATRRHAHDWLRHPVLGDPSFDAFERAPGNPVFQGTPPLAWPVNGFLFLDPVSRRSYLFVGEYAEGYVNPPSRCRLLRENPGAAGWTDLGVILQGDPASFDRGGHTPDVSVVHHGHRYHMIYDWGEPDFNAEGGLAYAWADRPEGPWHRAPQPVTRNSSLPKLLGRYQRTYAATLLRRRDDWLITGMMDAAPWSWVQFVMTAPRPEGPWSERRLVRHVERDDFHPPLLEFYPSFVHDGFVYAPATSVARNRNFNALFRAPLERATDPDAWTLVQHGSLWHSDPVPHEAFGIWGQTFSGQVDDAGTLLALFPSRDSRGRGTINLARRPWNQPLRPRGFVLSGHEAPGFSCLLHATREFRLESRFELHGTARLLWDHAGPLGPAQPSSDARPHPAVRSRHLALEFNARESGASWSLLREDEPGRLTPLAQGSLPPSPPPQRLHLLLDRRSDGTTTLQTPDALLWTGPTPTPPPSAAPGALGWWVEAHSHLAVSEFLLSGPRLPLLRTYLATEALLGAGENPARWTATRDPRFHPEGGFIARHPGARVKWNVPGRRFTLWSPRGPDFGDVEVRLDGRPAARLDLRAPANSPTAPVWTSPRVDGSAPGHAIVLQSLSGSLPVDVLVAESR